MDLSHLQIILWKNFWVRFRTWRWVGVLGITLLVGWANIQIHGKDHSRKQVVFPQFCALQFSDSTCRTGNRSVGFDRAKIVVYSPLNQIVTAAMEALGASTGLTMVGYNDSEGLENHMLTNYTPTTLAGIQFADSLAGKSSLPEKVDVTLRFRPEERVDGHQHWYTNKLSNKSAEKTGPREVKKREGASPGYFHEGFLPLQQLTTYFLILAQKKLLNNETLDRYNDLPQILMERFPHAAYQYTKNLLVMFEAFLVIFAVFLSMTVALEQLGLEKELKLNEMLKVNGLDESSARTALFLTAFCEAALPVVLWTVMMLLPISSGSVIKHSDLSLYVCFMMLMALYMTAMTLFLSSLFNRGVNWRNMFLNASGKSGGYTFGMGMIIMMAQTVIFMLLHLYFSAVMPGEFGIAKPWYFIFQPSYWKKQHRVSSDGQIADPAMAESTATGAHRDAVEPDPTDLKMGVDVRHLVRVFKGQDAPAVKDLSFRLYEGQVTALLGPNGAGKSTTISMIVGMLPPTKGTVLVDGWDITTNLGEARRSVSICPQHDTLFPNLKVGEHLKLFSTLKGLSGAAVEVDIARFLKLCGLEDKKEDYPKTLSGGMKRKLCIAVAFCGKSKVILLDEPTAGVDPTNRRAIWDLIRKQKSGKIILLTTHMMDEADLLGDRIIIIAEGEMKCCGTTFFLKKRFGSGYQLTIEKGPHFKSKEVEAFISRYISKVKTGSDVGQTMVVLVSQKHVAELPKLFEALDANLQSLNIISYGISITTLEEVFLKAGKDERIKRPKQHKSRSEVGMSGKKLATGALLASRQFLAMWMKRGIHIYRTPLMHLICVLFTVAGAVATVVLSEASLSDLPAWRFSLSHYDGPVILMETSTVNPYEKDFLQMLRHAKVHVKNVTNVTRFVLDDTKKKAWTTEGKYLFGVKFGAKTPNSEILVWFNNDYLHTPGLGLQLALRAVYKHQLGPQHDIHFTNHPVKFDAATKVRMEENAPISVTLYLRYGLNFSICLIVVFYVHENVSRFKNLQLTFGTKLSLFWSAAYLFDIAVCLVLILLMLLTILIHALVKGPPVFDQIGALFVLCVVYCMAVLPMVYFITRFISTTGLAIIYLMGIMMIIDSSCQSVSTMMEEYLKLKVDWLKRVMCYLFATVGFSEGLDRLQFNQMMVHQCNKALQTCRDTKMGESTCRRLICHQEAACCKWSAASFAWSKYGLGEVLLGMLSSWAIGFILMLWCELRLSTYKEERPIVEDPEEDSDIVQERFRVQNTAVEELNRESCIVLKNVSKTYGLCKLFEAVRNAHFTVQKNECFGLLGVNGAGKTTVFRMLTGDTKMTSGHAWTLGYNLRNQMGHVRRHISYCPQFDAIIDELTCKEAIVMFALIKGVPLADCAPLAVKTSEEFDFQPHLHKTVAKLSGGTKRKLSSALAMIGDPEIVYMDEPTTGMDVGTRRFLWNQIVKAYSSGTCVVLTTHSMEESEALCTRVAIMVDGKFKCLGTIQHLKSKYSQGFTLVVKANKNISDTAMTAVQTYIQQNFPDSRLAERQQELLTYSVTARVAWAKVFTIMQQAKSELQIEDYSISQNSLEQVFVSLTS